MRFYKYHGIGNDFIIIDTGSKPIDAAQVQAWCNRHTGIGADGVLSVQANNDGFYMQVINADGSIPEMCGNGLRCVARYLHEQGKVSQNAFTVHTNAGPHECKVISTKPYIIGITMRAPSFDAHQPIMLNTPVSVAGQNINLSTVSMGNPHAVTFDDLGDARFELGPALEHHPNFPRGANINFAKLVNEDSPCLRLHVWERGAGWTQACGTGACATVAAATKLGLMPYGQDVEVRLPGGSLVIRCDAPGAPIYMQGPAELVFQGELLS